MAIRFLCCWGIILLIIRFNVAYTEFGRQEGPFSYFRFLVDAEKTHSITVNTKMPLNPNYNEENIFQHCSRLHLLSLCHRHRRYHIVPAILPSILAGLRLDACACKPLTSYFSTSDFLYPERGRYEVNFRFPLLFNLIISLFFFFCSYHNSLKVLTAIFKKRFFGVLIS